MFDSGTRHAVFALLGDATTQDRQSRDEGSAKMARADSASQNLYRVAGTAAAVIAALSLAAIIVFIAWPPPYDGTVLDWFEFFQDNWLLGLLGMDLLLIFVLVLEVPVLLALYASLRMTDTTLIMIAVLLGFIGITLHLSSITAFEMLSLSNQYADASTDAERAQLIAAGEAALATYEGTAFHLNYVIGGTVVPLLVSTVMLESRNYGRLIAYVGIVAAVSSLGLYIPGIGLLLSVVSGVAFLVWYVFLAVTFNELARARDASGER